MKIKHKYLETLRKSPKSVKDISVETVGGKSMIRAWDFALSLYHKENNNLNKAISYLQNSCSNFSDTKKNREKTDLLISKLVDYDRSYLLLECENVKTLGRLSIDINHNNTLTGEVFRVDKSKEGEYYVTLMSREDKLWAHELRFPLLQLHYSNLYKCPFDMIKVGIYNSENNRHEYLSFDEDSLKQSWNEVLNLSNQINKFSIN